MFEDAIAALADGNRRTLAQLHLEQEQLQPLLAELDNLGITCQSSEDALQIPGGIELLNHDLIMSGLSPEALALVSEVEVHWTIDSTNSYLLAQQLQEPCHGVACFAEQQLQGRGRRGKHWVSPFARNLYLSLAWQISTRGEPLDGLSLAAGVTVAEALAVAGVAGIKLKWPNDLLHEGAKLGGILVEMTAPKEGRAGLVVGVGINLSMSAAVGGEIDQEWTDLARIAGQALSRNRVASLLLDHLLRMLDSFPARGFRGYRERWEALDGWRDQMVQLQIGGRTEIGREGGVDETGALRLITDSGVSHFAGGEVTLRRA